MTSYRSHKLYRSHTPYRGVHVVQGITFGGAAQVSKRLHHQPVGGPFGGIIFTGSATPTRRLHVKMSGGIVFGGSGIVPRTYSPSSIIHIIP